MKTEKLVALTTVNKDLIDKHVKSYEMQGVIPFDADAEDEYNLTIKMLIGRLVNSIFKENGSTLNPVMFNFARNLVLEYLCSNFREKIYSSIYSDDESKKRTKCMYHSLYLLNKNKEKMETKTVSISLPQIDGVELKNATVDLEKGVVIAEYGEKDIEKDISEIAVDFRSAVDYLYEDLHEYTFLTTKKHIPKLEAFNQLLILAEAWNNFDGFYPDWENQTQYKWHPMFRLKNGRIVFWDAGVVGFILDPYLSNFSFKTKKRAEQFGKQFIELFRIVLTN